MDKLVDFIEQNTIIYTVIATDDGKTWNEYGKKDDVIHQGIISQYIPGPEAVPMLFDMLKGQVLPQIVRQGIVTCIISQPLGDTVGVTFIHDESDVISRRRRATKIDKELSSILDSI